MIRAFLIFYALCATLLLGFYLVTNTSLWKEQYVTFAYSQSLPLGSTPSTLLECFCLPQDPDESDRPSLNAAQTKLEATGMDLPPEAIQWASKFDHRDFAGAAVILNATLSTHQEMIARVQREDGLAPRTDTKFIAEGVHTWQPLSFLLAGRQLGIAEGVTYELGPNESGLRAKTRSVVSLGDWKERPAESDPFFAPAPHPLSPNLELHVPGPAWPILLILALLPATFFTLLRKPIARAVRLTSWKRSATALP